MEAGSDAQRFDERETSPVVRAGDLGIRGRRRFPREQDALKPVRFDVARAE